ncbi:MAG: cytochrome c biogenesis protein CcsA, partial [Candidatus Eisenbacteria bacterium]|nr:cytochrome c biogenesis protein CcsA [Candidatus Eisenbacteria bacterium]
MPAGQLLVVLAFLTALIATVAYVPSLQTGARSKIAQGFFTAHAVLLVLALVTLAGLFLQHRFEYEYVAANSSRELSPALTFASMWAGQEGSILLWAAIGAITGLALALQPGRLSAPAMVFSGIAQLFMIGLLLVRSPFRLSDVVPANGQGLNPLLEDPWMVSHPPTLFVGYAAMLPPFALGAAALWRGEYEEWNRRVWPWTLFAVVSLGLGIVLGGIWAYKVLGWGGYWGWDPVENASLVPWLMAVALLHGLLIQRTLGAMTRTNLLLASLGWLTVVGGTYLTRSGVLSNFSVHSFADTGLGPVLTAFLMVFTLGAAGLLAWRWNAVAPKHVEWLNVSREAALWLGLMTVVTLAVMVAAGTTMPLLTGLAGKPASVRPEFYTAVTMPFALVILLLMAVAPVLRWSRQAGTSWLQTVGVGGIAGMAALVAAYALGLRDPLWLALLTATGWMLGLNAWVA